MSATPAGRTVCYIQLRTRLEETGISKHLLGVLSTEASVVQSCPYLFRTIHFIQQIQKQAESIYRDRP